MGQMVVCCQRQAALCFVSLVRLVRLTRWTGVNNSYFLLASSYFCLCVRIKTSDERSATSVGVGLRTVHANPPTVS